MKLEEARSLVFMALKKPGWNQVANIVNSVGLLRAELEGTKKQYASSGLEYLKPGDETLIMEIIWGLIIQGVLVPGINDSNTNLPFLRLTEYGKRGLEEDRFLPHDPDDFLRQFAQEIPHADPVIVEYLTESLQCFLRGLNRAAAVMLGAASEKAILLLCESFGNAITDSSRRTNYLRKMEKANSIFRRYEVFQRHFAPIIGKLPPQLREYMDSLLTGIFDLIRNSRNDAGHPASGVLIDRDVMYSHLRLFVPYCKRVYGLIAWFAANSV